MQLQERSDKILGERQRNAVQIEMSYKIAVKLTFVSKTAHG